MGFLDTVKARLAPAGEKVAGLARQHEDRIGHGLDKAARTVDDRTRGKYSRRIETGTGKAKEALGRIAHREDGGAAGPPAP
ncbi:antitoxin [Streptomyces genisteinicus]|uniref:Antitoxin n=1 Tax=Streptomyces genisteinicus TaxID=2768068 RepID=A0A7H0HYQ1_9ACTN|nr:antitoxin [Streptomyces genisteinicus]QNP65667.1 antitoxin [Streptomyces genisteinicus]